MSLRTLLVHGAVDNRMLARSTLAATLAREHDASLAFVFPLQGASAALMYAEHVPAAAIQRQIETERQHATEIRARIADRMAHEGVRMEWRSLEGRPVSLLAGAGSVADIIVMSQDPHDADVPMVAAVVLTAGRPVLCVPHTGSFATCGRRILLAWNGSRESARATHDALPLLRRAGAVRIFAGDTVSDGGASPEDAAAHLAAHGAKVDLRRGTLGDVDAGRAILDAATEWGADLIVMGAYGHSRLREWVFGGATRTVLRSMTVPTLLSY
ncbi:MAG TPA: universal stress protein [Vineibacter sp.]|nr:universal stress protein [Vineibacter sp.]